MKGTRLFFSALIAFISLFLLPGDLLSTDSTQQSISIIVSADIYSGIDTSLQQFKTDLENEGYSVIIEKSAMRTPEEVRTYLQELYQTSSPKLIGAALVGDIPYAYQSFPMQDTLSPRSPTDYLCISFQYYSDLDGNFEKTNPKYPDHYSSHTGNIFPEIWISVLPMYNDDINETIVRLNSYFKKNHEYRTGRSGLQEGFLYIDEFVNPATQRDYDEIAQSLISGQYSWNPLTTWGNVKFVINNQIGEETPVEAYTQELSKTDYTFAVLAAHGTETSNGELTTELVKRIKLSPAFLWLDGCSTGNIDSTNNILLEIVYSPKSNVLAAKGGTTSVGGLGNNVNGYYGHNIAEKLLEEKSLGEALLYHFQDSLVSPWSEDFEMHNAPNIFIGDLSLTLFPKNLTVIDKQISNKNDYILFQNYPNPFNPVTNLGFRIPETPLSRGIGGVLVVLKVFDVLGNEIATLVNEEKAPGNYQVKFDASNLSTGVYLYKLTAGSFTSTKKFMLMK